MQNQFLLTPYFLDRYSPELAALQTPPPGRSTQRPFLTAVSSSAWQLLWVRWPISRLMRLPRAGAR